MRRLDAVLEPTEAAVLEMKKRLDKAKVANQDARLCQAAASLPDELDAEKSVTDTEFDEDGNATVAEADE